MVALYKQIKPDDAFGRMMIHNLQVITWQQWSMCVGATKLSLFLYRVVALNCVVSMPIQNWRIRNSDFYDWDGMMPKRWILIWCMTHCWTHVIFQGWQNWKCWMRWRNGDSCQNITALLGHTNHPMQRVHFLQLLWVSWITWYDGWITDTRFSFQTRDYPMKDKLQNHKRRWVFLVYTYGLRIATLMILSKRQSCRIGHIKWI